MMSSARLAFVIAITFAPAPSSAAQVSTTAKPGVYALDAQGSTVGETVKALALKIGATITGDSQSLHRPAPGAKMTGTAAQLLARLLGGQGYVLKTGPKGAITQIAVMSGARGADPSRAQIAAASPPPAASAPSTLQTGAEGKPAAPAVSTTTLAMTTAPQPGEAAPPAPPTPRASSAASGMPPGVTPEMQAQIAAATQQASRNLQTLVTQLKAATPPAPTK
jgi:hypothetical protein